MKAMPDDDFELAEPPAEWDPFEGMTGDEIVANLKDAFWRITHLYWIKDKAGLPVLFQPNEVQLKFLTDLWHRNVVPKARQRGFSTVTQIMILDACLFAPGTTAGIIAQDAETALGIRDEKILYAYERLPEFLQVGVFFVKKNEDYLEWSNGSKLIVSTSVRGRTLQYLHISEYGIICKKTPEKANEIRNGSLPAVDAEGIVVIESTAEGRDGDFFAKCMSAQKAAMRGTPLTKLEYKLHFASWWDAEEYELDPEHVVITPKDHQYFDAKETEIGRPIGPRKRAWYVVQREETFGGDQQAMKEQYPTTLEEAFELASDGVWYANQLLAARIQGRIGSFPYRPALPVNTFWDIGVSDDIAIWFHQFVDGMDHWIDYWETSAAPYAEVAREIHAKPYVYAGHYLPHDAGHRRPGILTVDTPADMLRAVQLKNIHIVPRTDLVTNAIQLCRTDFSTYRFNEETTKEGLEHLDGYMKVFNERTGTWTSVPLKNGHQHCADAFRAKAQAASAGIIRAGGPRRLIPTRRRASC